MQPVGGAVAVPGGTSGADLARETRRRWPELRVLFTSGYMQEAFLRHGRLDPGFELLEKPFTKSDLARKIREVLSADAA